MLQLIFIESDDEIKQLIKSGEMCDGLSISAFALAAVNDWE